jgi:hypothetical protein
MVTDQSTQVGILTKLLILLVMLEEECNNEDGSDDPDVHSHVRAAQLHQKEVASVLHNASIVDTKAAFQSAANYLGFRLYSSVGGDLAQLCDDQLVHLHELVAQVGVRF